jgi:hypothetical protein
VIDGQSLALGESCPLNDADSEGDALNHRDRPHRATRRRRS